MYALQKGGYASVVDHMKRSLDQINPLAEVSGRRQRKQSRVTVSTPPLNADMRDCFLKKSAISFL